MAERTTSRNRPTHGVPARAKTVAPAARPAKAARSPAPQPHAPPKSGFGKKTIALVYDFDGTLSPRPMQEYTFLPKIGENAAHFWAESNRLAREQGADPLITYMHLMYKKAKEKGVRIDREDLVQLGRDVELFPGVTEWFDEIGSLAASLPTPVVFLSSTHPVFWLIR